MTEIIYCTVGENIDIYFQWDGYVNIPPSIITILNPNLSYTTGLPIYMEYIKNNLFYFQLKIPYHINYVGDTIIDIQYSIEPLNKIYQIIAKPPFGLSGNRNLHPLII